MASHDGRLPLRWAWPLLILTSTASALSLSNFQLITSSAIPLGCIIAYDFEIFGCAMKDFVAGSACSASCVRGLRRIENQLQDACVGVDASPSSVLGQVLMGNTVELLCSGTPFETPTSSTSGRPTASPATTPSRTPSTTPITRTSSRGALTLTTVRPPTTMTTTTSSSTVATETETETEEPDTSTSTSTSTSGPTSTAVLDIPFPTTFIQSSPPTSESSTSPTPSPAPEPDSGNSSGGGSPFDIPTSDSRQLAACCRKAVTAALGLGLFLLR